MRSAKKGKLDEAVAAAAKETGWFILEHTFCMRGFWDQDNIHMIPFVAHAGHDLRNRLGDEDFGGNSMPSFELSSFWRPALWLRMPEESKSAPEALSKRELQPRWTVCQPDKLDWIGFVWDRGLLQHPWHVG